VVMRVQTGSPVDYPMLRWRGVALSTFERETLVLTRYRGARNSTLRGRMDGFRSVSQLDLKVPAVAQLRFVVFAPAPSPATLCLRPRR